MTPSQFAQLREAVQTDEGLRLVPYVDTVGKVTIGYGRNLTDVGVTKGEALQLLDNDLTNAIATLTRAHPIVLTLDPVRQIVLANMAFNLGVPALSGFKQLWAALEVGNYQDASIAMLDSHWATQVGARATRLASEMLSGEFK